MTIDLRKCRPGDKLLSQHWMEFTYIVANTYSLPHQRSKRIRLIYCHTIRDQNGFDKAAADDGKVFEPGSPENSHDIIRILSQDDLENGIPSRPRTEDEFRRWFPNRRSIDKALSLEGCIETLKELTAEFPKTLRVFPTIDENFVFLENPDKTNRPIFFHFLVPIDLDEIGQDESSVKRAPDGRKIPPGYYYSEVLGGIFPEKSVPLL